MNPPRRLLVVIRHARAESFAGDDHARSLTDRGQEAAAAAGRWLADRSLVPARAYVSSAVRAMQTWEAVAAALPGAPSPTVEPGLYAGGVDAAIDVLRSAEPDSGCLALVGHNPAVALLATLLDSGDPDPEAFRELSAGYPPAALTVLEIPVPWAELTEGCGRITAFHVAKG